MERIAILISLAALSSLRGTLGALCATHLGSGGDVAEHGLLTVVHRHQFLVALALRAQAGVLGLEGAELGLHLGGHTFAAAVGTINHRLHFLIERAHLVAERLVTGGDWHTRFPS